MGFLAYGDLLFLVLGALERMMCMALQLKGGFPVAPLYPPSGTHFDRTWNRMVSMGICFFGFGDFGTYDVYGAPAQGGLS
ncbi:MAG: hypothetical protein J1E43_12490, partial [Christensenellaceae bacterium]|nr:hypothetical protein [Christensenellaceae bacterium]